MGVGVARGADPARLPPLADARRADHRRRDPGRGVLGWSLSGAAASIPLAGWGLATSVWVGGALIGAASAFAVPEPRATRLPEGRVRLPASWMPLVTYLAVFVARFACAAWAAMDERQAVTAAMIAVAISAAAAARLAAGVLRWRATDGAI